MHEGQVLERILFGFRNEYDIVRPFRLGTSVYDAFAEYRVTNTRYVLSKKAELWRTLSFEYVFFKTIEKDLQMELNHFYEQVRTSIEHDHVRRGEKYPPKDHMNSYITGFFFCREGISDAELRRIKSMRFSKNYLFGVRGFCEMRLVVFDLNNESIVGNHAARALVKAYRQENIF